MYSQKRLCMLGQTMAYAKQLGRVVDERELEQALKTTHAKATYARATEKYDAKIAETYGLPNLDLNSVQAKGYSILESAGVPARELHHFVQNPNAVLSDQITEGVHKIYLDHMAKYGRENSAAWNKEAVPQLQALRKEVMEGIDPLARDYAEKYFQYQIRGGQLYHGQRPDGPISGLVRNAIGNLITWNPVITFLNTFEFMPKALGYAIEKKGIAGGTSAVIRAMGDFVANSKGNVTGRIPELDALGVYGFDELGRNFLGMRNLLDVTENPLRSLSYYLGEAVNPGGGLDGLEKVAFVYKLGNEPQILWSNTGSDTLALMRFTIASNKFYLNLLKNASKPESAAALAAYSLMNAVQTGGGSMIPAPVYAFLDDDTKQSIAEFDDKTGLNAAKHIFGTDLADSTRPLPGAAIGVGYAILQQDIAGSAGAAVKAAEAAGEGDYALASAKFLEGLFGVGQAGRIPGINMTTKRFVQVLSDVAAGDVAPTPEDIGMEFLKKTKVYKEPE